MTATYTYESPGPWRQAGACRGVDPASFFVDESDPEALAAAKAFCNRCPSAQICLIDALSRGEYDGVLGGLSALERRTAFIFLGRLKRCAYSGCSQLFRTRSNVVYCSPACRKQERRRQKARSYATSARRWEA